jgi:hypothetical protein
MSDNVEVKDGDSDQQPEPKQFTDIEQRAADQGWRPKDEWEGDPEEWRSAKEFLDRGEFFKKIEDQNRTIKELRKTQADFAKHYERMRKTEYERALETLKAQKKAALQEQDVDAVVEIDDRIEQVREAARNIEVPQVPDVQPELNPLFVAWKERNGWYETNQAMRAYADRLGTQLTGSPAEILAEVEKQVKKEFAHKFENPRRNSDSQVEGGTNKGPSKKETFQLTEDERRAMRRFVNQGIITEEQYIKDLKEAKARGL